MFLDLWITSEVGNLVLIYMRSFFKDSYFATATAVIINVHFSITCLPLSYSSPSTTLCIITVTHRKSEGGDRMCVWANRGARARVCVSSVCRECVLVNEPVFICVSMQNMVHMCLYLACLSAHTCESACVCVDVCVCVRLLGLWGGVRGGCCVQCPPKAKTCQASILPDGTSWRYSCKPSSCDLTQLDCP